MPPAEPHDLAQRIIDQLADALIHTDREGYIRQWNAAAERLFGFSRTEAIGSYLDLIIPERLRAAHWAGFHRAMSAGATRHAGRATVTRTLTRDGSTRYVEMSFAVVLDDAGHAIGSVAVARDVDEHERRARQTAAG